MDSLGVLLKFQFHKMRLCAVVRQYVTRSLTPYCTVDYFSPFLMTLLLIFYKQGFDYFVISKMVTTDTNTSICNTMPTHFSVCT